MSTKKPSPGHMAWLLGEALKAGGVQVHQTKEKFGSIRVYVSVPNNHDARMHYRDMYRAAMAACPELAENLPSGADRREWLFEAETDLEEYVARPIERGGSNAFDAWSPHFKLARQITRGEDTSDFLDGDCEIEEVTEPQKEVTISRDLFEAAHAAVAWACVQSGGGGWTDAYHQLTNALNGKEKK